jgi:hypothetical protein
MATVNHNRNGQLACITFLEARMDDLERAILISGIGAAQFENMRLNLTALRQVTQEMRMPVGQSPSLINNEERDRARGVMRPPKYRGD